jgi:hypothetical protein
MNMQSITTGRVSLYKRVILNMIEPMDLRSNLTVVYPLPSLFEVTVDPFSKKKLLKSNV